MIDVAVVAHAMTSSRNDPRSEVEMIADVVARASASVGLDRQRDVDFVCSGSADYLTGVPFSFMKATDSFPAWPPLQESHVEMDGAWALYEAMIRLQHGDINTALVYSFGKSSMGELVDLLALQLDPYILAPLWVDSISMAALQANALLQASAYTEWDLADVAFRSRMAAADNEHAQIRHSAPINELLEEPYIVFPLRRHDCPPITDGAAAVVLATRNRAQELTERPAWIRGIDHRIEPHALGRRELIRSPSAMAAAEASGARRAPVDVMEIHAPFSHQELILRDAIGVGENTVVNPSGGALAANPMMSAGLIRLIEAARSVMEGRAERALGHATSGPCLQQNLVAVFEGTGYG